MGKHEAVIPSLESIELYLERKKTLLQAAESHILVLDGAMGTAIQERNLTSNDFGGIDFEGCNEYLSLTQPQIILDIHKKYLQSGCDIIETNTFGSTQMVLEEYALGHRAYDITLAATQLARLAADEFTAQNPEKPREKPRFVAGSMGPTTKALSVTGGTTFQNLIQQFYNQAKALIEGGADYLLIETAQDSRNIKAALLGIEKFELEFFGSSDRLAKCPANRFLVAVSGTIETMGTMLAGQTIEALLASVMHRDLFYIGLNCATGPQFMTDHIRTLAQLAPFRVACVPNAGLPDEDGCYLETPEMMGKIIEYFAKENWINFVGGCCGTHFGHIKTFTDVVKEKTPRQIPSFHRSFLSGTEFLEISDEMRPVIVGERTNVIGSKKFRDLITTGKFEEAAEIARAQVKSGAHIIDICLSNPDRNEFEDLKLFMESAVKLVKVPFMIDSTDAKCIEMALTYCQGKALINSINLEDGEERYEKIVPLAKSYGAALVVGTIDEDPNNGMAITRKRKLEIAKKSYDLLVHKYQIRPEDIYFDALVFPCGTGDQNYVGSALETIEGIRLIKQNFPNCRTVLGISNVSFGLPTAGREVLNSVFLHHCVQAGLDLAIVNSEKLERFASIPPEEVELANHLLFNQSTSNSDPVTCFVAHFREKKSKPKVDRSSISLEERLSQNIIQGTKEGLTEDLNLAILTRKPLDVINGPLMSGMDEVGRLFNKNKLIVAEVLQSAEVMKFAVAHLEQFMEKSENTVRGTMLLATVKGDVHDIGKNLVDIILSNNGFNVINLGIKVPPEVLIEKVREHKPDMIGLSGLLVKSALQMIVTAEDLARAGIDIPIIVGGAALSRNFTEKRILPTYQGPVLYAQDAMNGLDLAKQVRDPNQWEQIKIETNEKRNSTFNLKSTISTTASITTSTTTSSSTETFHSDCIEVLSFIPQPSNFQRHVLRSTPIEHIWKYINPLMLYTRHLGIKAKSAKLLAEAETDKKVLKQLQVEDPKAIEIFECVQAVKEVYGQTTFAPAAVYQFFKAHSQGNSIKLFNEDHHLLSEFNFLRQKQAPKLCLADYVNKAENNVAKNENLALFVVTAGHNVRAAYLDLKERGEFLKSHVIQALALETAEAYAEYLHSFLRAQWGFPDKPNMTAIERFQAKYHGKRYSFGYPACPRLEDQRLLFDLLNPEEIGVNLTEGFMMEPEASVSALVFHHPQAQYFSVENSFETAANVNLR